MTKWHNEALKCKTLGAIAPMAQRNFNTRVHIVYLLRILTSHFSDQRPSVCIIEATF